MDRNALCRYVPHIVLTRFQNDPGRLTEPEMQAFTAAVAFFGISGFSSLASELRKQEAGQLVEEGSTDTKESLITMAQQGVATEELTSILNKTLEPIIEWIIKSGGDIIKFVGDAMIVIWETEATKNINTPIGILVYHAMKSALQGIEILMSNPSNTLGVY